MKYLARIQAGQQTPRAIESLYAMALAEQAAAEFCDDLETAYAAAPGDLVLEAWHWRLAPAADHGGARRAINWAVALPLSLLTALLLWLLSDERIQFTDPAGHTTPYLLVLITPLIALLALAFFALVRGQGYRVPVMLGAGLTVLAANATWRSATHAEFVQLAFTHLPLLAWAAVGVYATGTRAGATHRFAFLAKSIEVTVVTGLYAMAAGAFGAITTLLFKTLGITLSETIVRLLMVGGAGLMPMIAVASVYDPLAAPAAQDFKRGLSRIVTTLPRLLLALTFVVLVVYIALIPANFMKPFHDRTALISYNVMLFAVIALLLGATPVSEDDLSPHYQRWLRRGIASVAALSLLVGVYALAAVAYRTAQDRLTINRLTIIGWNTINIGLLGMLLVRQRTGGAARWIVSLHEAFSAASVAYVTWAAVVTVVLAGFF